MGIAKILKLHSVFSSLEKSGIPYTVCDTVSSEPTTGMLGSISDSLDLSSFDSVIAAGGGSVIDSNTINNHF